MKPQRVRFKRGFTLIELMIVVVILSILAVIMVTGMLRVVSKVRKQRKNAKMAVAVAQNSLEIRRLVKGEDGRWVAKKNLPSAVVSSRVGVSLRVHYVLERGRVVPVYHADFEGDYLLRNPSRAALRSVVFFPFPRGAGTFSDIQFSVSPRKISLTGAPTSRPVVRPRVRTVEKHRLIKPKFGVSISPGGVRWTRTFFGGEEVRVKIKYRVRGRDHYRYRIASGKKRSFQFRMDVLGVDPEIPPQALQPGRQTRVLLGQSFTNRYQWDFRNFLSTENIEVRFPPQFSKYYRFSLLGRLGGIALLFFALFFWFFGERQRPEKITRLNFSLLLLGFVSFFPLFIFLDEHVHMNRAFVISLSTAMVLTTFHVSTFMGTRWALMMSLPLQLFFTCGFTFAVLLPTYRPLAFTIGAIILVAFIIVFHARYQKEREVQIAEEERKMREWQEQLRAEELELARKTEEEQALLAKEAVGLSSENLEVEGAIHSSAGLTVLLEHEAEVVAGEEAVAVEEVSGSGQRFSEFCLFCGVKVDPHFRHCYDCGELLKRTHACGGCGAEYWYPSVEEFSHCRQCGDRLEAPHVYLKEKGAFPEPSS